MHARKFDMGSGELRGISDSFVQGIVSYPSDLKQLLENASVLN